MRIRLILIFSLLGLLASAQNRIPELSNKAKISLLTIGPGPELYDSFGHTAVRVNDPTQGIDVVFNYGLFDFDTPNFYGKFVQGKLLYRLGIAPFDKFLLNYKAQNRTIKSQELLQSKLERQELFDFIFTNAQKGNDTYLYDFLYDNCATRPANAINGIYKEDIFQSFMPELEGLTHRQLIQKNVPQNTWGSLGMDIAIGAVTDRKVSNKEYLFLPEYTMKALESAQVNKDNSKVALAAPIQNIFIPEQPNTYREKWLFSPINVLSIIAFFIVYITYKHWTKKRGFTFLDKGMLWVLGLIGVVLALLWFATDHAPTKWNYNLLWAFPFHILAALSLRKSNNKRWLTPYFKLVIILMVLMVFHWIVGVQSFHWTLVPLLIAIVYRYLYMLRSLQTETA